MRLSSGSRQSPSGTNTGSSASQPVGSVAGDIDGPRFQDWEAMFDIHHISTDQLAQLGLRRIAYVKVVVINGTTCFAIHAADGSPMALTDDLDIAVTAIVEHDMIPVRVH
jgi:hypothetical protein